MTGTSTEDKPQSATGAVLGSPILRSQEMVGDITSRKLLVQASKPDRPSVRNIEPKKHAPRSNRRSPQKRAPLSDLRSLPAYISPTAFAVVGEPAEVGDGEGVGVHADAARPVVREQGDHRAAPGQRAERVHSRDL